MPKKTFTHDKKTGQLEIPDDASQAREFFLERKIYVPLKIELVDDVHVRYPEKDRCFHVYDAADLSYESIDPISHAGVVTYEDDPRGARGYMQTATISYEKHLGSGKKDVLSAEAEKEVVRFFKNYSDVDEEVDALQDHFSKLMKDAQ